MNFSPELSTAIISVFGSLLIASIGYWAGRERLIRENKLDYNTEYFLNKLLKRKEFKKTSLEKIKKHIRGYEDNELRKCLIRAGALCFGGIGDQEKWGLSNRNKDELKVKKNPKPTS